MTASSALVPLALLSLVLGAVAAGLDLHAVETHTLVVYTTPAVKDFLERSAIPRFRAETGVPVVTVYLSAAEEYHRLRMSGDRPEASVMVHASPLFLEKGYAEGVMSSFDVGVDLGFGNQSRIVPGGRVWQAFAWSPLVEVFRPGEGPVDLANDTGRFGFAHPLLSNNGVYNVLLFEALDPAAGRAALNRTVVQPVNAAATIGGVADGGYDLTLGYEAVVALYQGKGARVEAALPVLGGERVTTPVLFSAGLVRGHPHPAAVAFIESLFGPETQGDLHRYTLRPVVEGAPQPQGIDLGDTRVLHQDWSQWRDLEATLPSYEVTS